jgi:predicted transport protein
LAVKFDTIRTYALSLDAVTEEPHHNYSSFRVRGKIFVTVPPDKEFIHVFVGEEDRERFLAMHPDSLEKLLWGRKALGLRIKLASSPPALVKSLVAKAYETRVSKDAGPKTFKPKREPL